MRGKKVDGKTNLTKVPPTHSALRFSLELRHLEFACGAAQYIGLEGGMQHRKEEDVEGSPHNLLAKLTP